MFTVTHFLDYIVTTRVATSTAELSDHITTLNDAMSAAMRAMMHHLPDADLQEIVDRDVATRNSLKQELRETPIWNLASIKEIWAHRLIAYADVTLDIAQNATVQANMTDVDSALITAVETKRAVLVEAVDQHVQIMDRVRTNAQSISEVRNAISEFHPNSGNNILNDPRILRNWDRL